MNDELAFRTHYEITLEDEERGLEMKYQVTELDHLGDEMEQFINNIPALLKMDVKDKLYDERVIDYVDHIRDSYCNVKLTNLHVRPLHYFSIVINHYNNVEVLAQYKIMKPTVGNNCTAYIVRTK